MCPMCEALGLRMVQHRAAWVKRPDMEIDVMVREMHWFSSLSPLVVQQNTRAKNLSSLVNTPPGCRGCSYSGLVVQHRCAWWQSSSSGRTACLLPSTIREALSQQKASQAKQACDWLVDIIRVPACVSVWSNKMSCVKAPQLGVYRNQQESPLSACTRGLQSSVMLGFGPFLILCTSHISCTVLLRDCFFGQSWCLDLKVCHKCQSGCFFFFCSLSWNQIIFSVNSCRLSESEIQ